MIKRYLATKDNIITNAFQEDLKTRGTGSNMGASDILEVFSIYGQAASGSTELARSLIQFNTDEISADRTAGTLAASGSVTWYLKMYDAAHIQTTPRDYKLVVSPISTDCEEGYGIDMDNYEDLTTGGIGSNWVSASSTTVWSKVGGDYHITQPGQIVEQTFETGFED